MAHQDFYLVAGFERGMISHTGTETRPRLLREAAVGNIAETRPRLLREAAVGNIGQWAKA